VVVLFVGGLQFTLGGGISIIGWNQVISIHIFSQNLFIELQTITFQDEHNRYN
jgi:hypothetical protein